MNNQLLIELNKEQRQAVEQIDGAILILAGAGTGKTKTITYRIANMIENNGISPYSILALTFTNKASNEMRERITSLIGDEAKKCTISTFHAFGLRLLRVYYDYIGYEENITVYDTDDQKKAIEELDKRYNLLNEMDMDIGTLIGYFSNFKEFELVDDINAMEQALLKHPKKQYIIDFFNYYERFLKENNAIDFADILYLTKKLLENKEILNKVQERYKYIMVDEYQDTNQIQFRIIEMIASKYENICVVGDDNQSIYKFRGADIRNILSFNKTYPNAKTIRLEQNYRSTKVIIDSSNKVIDCNKAKTDKQLWTANEKGELIKVLQCRNNYAEGDKVCFEIKNLIKKGYSYNDITILYRTNAQSRIFEDKFLRENIPFKIFGGLSFYDRLEIKDMISFLKLFYNPNDDIALMRVLNTPKKRIGDVSLERLREFAEKYDISLFESLRYAKEINLTNVAREEIEKFYFLIKRSQSKLESGTEIVKILENFLEETHYFDFIQSNIKYRENYEDRCENIEEFKLLITEMEDKSSDNGDKLGMLLEEISLKKSIRDEEESLNAVKLMTIHNSKGLEFPVVFIVGMVKDIFPSFRCQTEEDLEEERRICYVALTRAKKELYLSFYTERIMYNKPKKAYPNLFLNEIPNSNMQIIKENIYDEFDFDLE
jgi:ATP-dependent DNA helicase pcrA